MIVPKNIYDLPDDMRATVVAVDTLFDDVYLVGGAVRDVIMKRKTQDFDFTTPEPVDSIARKLQENPLFKVREDGRAYGTVAATIGEHDVQITTYRDEVYEAGSRRPIVSGATDIDSDLSRRDFTINTIALSRDELVDPYNGLQDIVKKTIRAIGDPSVRFREDPLRILRAFRFVSTLGFEIEEQTLLAATKQQNNINIVSQERIGVEFQKLMQGKYWSDALNELSDSNILNTILKHVDTPYSVNASDVTHVFEQYSANTLESMGIARRWRYLIEIVYYAAKSNGVASVPLVSVAEKLVGSVQLSKELKKEVFAEIERVANISGDAEKSSNTGVNSLSDMKSSYLNLKSSGDQRWMIEGAKYYTEIGRQNLREYKYIQAKKNFQQAVNITEENYAFLLSWTDPEKKAQKLRAIKPHFLSRLRYFYIVLILESRLFETMSSTDTVHRYLRKQLVSSHVSKSDLAMTIDRAIAHVYKMNVRGTTVEPYEEFLHKSNIALPEEDKLRYNRELIAQQLRDGTLTPQEKARLYKEKMSIASRKKSDQGDLGLEYYDPYIDYLYNKMLGSRSLDRFYKYYEEYCDMTPKYLALMSNQRNAWAGERNVNLTAASAHVYALTLAKTVEEKLSISQKVVELYEISNSKLNAARYGIYVDWFTFAKLLLESSFTSKTLRGLLDILRGGKRSIRYTDPDEDYLLTQRANIVDKRGLLKDSLSFIAALNGLRVTDITLRDRSIAALQTLLENEVLTREDAFTVYKNMISKIEHKTLELDHIEQTDREFEVQQDDELIRLLAGESETMEYKSSWKLDVKRYRATKNKQREPSREVTKSALKSIAGLMNKRGGILLIGVEDDCKVIGLESTDYLLGSSKDARVLLDNMQKDMRTDIINTLGPDVYNRLQVDPIRTRDKVTVLKITVPTADPSRPCIYKDSEGEKYYVRSGTTCESAGMQAALDRMRS